MLTTIFRLGPLFLLEWALLAGNVLIWLCLNLPDCVYYTLAYLALVIFLIEMTVSLRLLKSNTSISRKYLHSRATESKLKYTLRTIWDNLNIILVIMLLYYSLIADGINLFQLNQSIKATEGQSQITGSYGDETCEFTLFALCLFTELQKTLNNQASQDIMVMWLLYAASAFITTMTCVLFSKQYYHYCSSIINNRKLLRQLGNLNQTLIDCHVYSIRSEMLGNEQLRTTIGDCSICLREIVEESIDSQEQKVIRLRCRHIFHKRCIDQWLKVKDNCPFRCMRTK